MPNHDDEDIIIIPEDEKPEFIPVDDAYVAERLKNNPGLAREYERIKPKYDRMLRQIRAKDARRAKRKAFIKRLRTFWATLRQGISRIAY